MKTTKLTTEEKESRKIARKEAKKQAKELAKIQAEKDQKPIKSITINIEWRKSRMWGNNPFCTASVNFQDGTFERSDVFTCSGCGYDKESTVISQVFNTYLKYKLHIPELATKPDKPYGFRIDPDWKYYDGGVGTSCYYRISEFIGGKFENVASGKTFDVYKYTDL